MKCIVVDDEPLARQGMELMIREVPFLQLCGTFANAIEADLFLQRNEVDLLFLDIQMPKMTGLDYLRNKQQMHQTILTTAYPQYALEGFELDVVDYLVKPIRFERFYKAVNKALQRHQSPASGVSGKQSIEIEENYVFVRADRKFIRVSFTNVLYIEGLKDYVVVHCPPEKIMVAVNLKTIQAQLPPAYFMRIGKSYIVNLTQIQSVDSDFVYIGKEQLPIGDGYKEDLLNYITRTGIIRRG